MTALVQDRKCDQLGTADVAYPVLLRYPVEASTSIYGGALVAINAAGNAVPASAIGALKCVGRAERQCINLAQTSGGTTSPDGIATGTAGSISVPVHQGAFYLNINADSTITKASFGANVYASDDNTVSLTDGGGTRPYAGWIIDAPISSTVANMGVSASLVGVFVGVANPYALNPELSSATQYKARNVVTSLQAYGGSGTNVLTQTTLASGWATQDGVTNAVGDVVFIQAGTANLTAALDSGPWVLTTIGSASIKWVLTRPDWWTTGATMPLAAVIDVGGEGTAWLGTSWKSFAAPATVIGTTDPAFYVGRLTQSVTLVTGFTTKTNVGIKSTTTTGIEFTPTNFSGGASTVSYRTGVYASGGAATAAGYAGTGSVSITALVAAGTFNTSDVGSGLLTIINW